MIAAMPFLRAAVGFLAVGITIPLWLIAGVVLWWQFDKHSAVRHAVEAAVTDLIDGAELEAERAKNAGLQKILDKRDADAEHDRAALAQFAELLSAAETEKEGLADELAELEAMPAPDQCVVDDGFLERLRQ